MIALTEITDRAALGEMFNRQADMAVRLSGDEAGIEALRPLLLEITEAEMEVGAGIIPFIIVPQGPTITLNRLMREVKIEVEQQETVGRSNLKDSNMSNVGCVVPQGHYLMIGVEDGRAMLNVSPSKCAERFFQEDRLPGTAAEGAALTAYFPEILEHHGLDLPGSRYRYDGQARDFKGRQGYPLIRAEENGAVMAVYYRDDDGFTNFGSPSCARRLGVTRADSSPKRRRKVFFPFVWSRSWWY